MAHVADRWARNRCVILNVVLIVLATAAIFGQTVNTFVPARRLGGSLPSTPAPNVVGWVEETLEVLVDAAGHVSGMMPLRASPLPTDPLTGPVANWTFHPAIDRGVVVPSRVLVTAIFRPPQLLNTPALGDPPVDLAAPSDETPFPIVMESPPYPPLAIGNGVVLVEALVGVDGRIRQLNLVTSRSGFDQAAVDAARRWSFRPARWNDRPVEAYAYLLFGFREPATAN